MQRIVIGIVVACLFGGTAVRVGAQEFQQLGPIAPPRALPIQSLQHIAAVNVDAVRAWDGEIQSFLRTGELQWARTDVNSQLDGHTHERLTQYHDGVPIYGSGVVREMVGGVAVSLSGSLHRTVDVNTTPTVSFEGATRALGIDENDIVPGTLKLVVLPGEERLGEAITYALAYQFDLIDRTAFSIDHVFVDAHRGEILRRYSALQHQQGHTATGLGTKGDTKKLSVTRQSTWNVDLARDSIRPARIDVYDLRYDLDEGWYRFTGQKALGETDLASVAAGSHWTDQGVVDTHAYLGWTYDYLYERFGRQGLDGQNGAIRALTHWPSPNDLEQYPSLRRFFCNASWNSHLKQIFIGGTLASQCNPFAGAFDVIAHELAHGVTSTSSGLLYEDESGALNEAFSDIIGISAEYFHQAKNSGVPYPVNYQLGETTGKAVRDMQDPASMYYFYLADGRGAWSNPNHYASRWIRTEPLSTAPDHGWVHYNSSIVNHAFYLAIEGGQYPRSKSNQSVQGVGAAKRADIERAFYQAFTYHLTASARMKDARYWTIEKAPNAAARAAISDAWDAVGIHGDQDVVAVWLPGTEKKCGANGVTLRIGIVNTSPRTFHVSSLYFDLDLALMNTHQHETTMSEDTFGYYFGEKAIPGYGIVASNLCWPGVHPGVAFSLEADLHGAHVGGVQTTYYAGRWQSFFNE